MSDWLKTLEQKFTVTPQRMRMYVQALDLERGEESKWGGRTGADRSRFLVPARRIVDSFIEVLEKGLAEMGQEVVSRPELRESTCG